MKKMKGKMIFTMVVVALVFCFSMGVTATTTPVTANVKVDVQMDGAFALPYQTVTVDSGLAEAYGYTDAVDSAADVSALDVLVKLHVIKYGAAFTAATAADYLVVTDGLINKAFGKNSGDWGVALNGESAHSDTLDGSGYAALPVQQTPVVTGDQLEFLQYQDDSYGEKYLWLMQDGKRVNSLDVEADAAVDLTLAGYLFAQYSNYGTDTITSDYLAAVGGAQFAVMNADGSLTDMDGAVSDTDGNVTLSFSDCGTYTVVAYLPDTAGNLVFLPVLTVNVHKAVKASVYTDVQIGGDFALPYQLVRVRSDLAESYGYTDAVAFWENVSALDVLVKLHKMEYGDAFTTATCKNYLVVTGGKVNKAFGETTGDWGIALNGESAHADVLTEHGYQSYLVHQTAVASGDVVEFLKYQTDACDENYIWMMQDGKRVDAVSVPVGESVNLTLEGYLFAQYSNYGTDTIQSAYLSAIPGLQLGVMDKKGKITNIKDAVTGADGSVSFSFSKQGTYTVVAYAPNASHIPMFMPVVSINVYKQKNAANMSDVVHGKWYYNSISAMLSTGLMAGTSETEFSPDSAVTRGMFVAILYRYAGSPFCESEVPFTDVASDAYYADAVAWAYDNDITCGITATEFAPNDYITREQMAAMIVSFADVVGYELPYADGKTIFADDGSISDYANASIYRLVKAGIVKGVGNNKFAPKSTATRAETAQIIYQLQNMQ